MADIKTTGATSALNEDQYINKLYDNMIGKQKDQLAADQNAAAGDLDALNESVQQQVNTNLGRSDVEMQKAQQTYKPPNVSPGAQQQIALAMDNQKKRNTTSIRTEQEEADAEIERQRQLIGQQYAAAIQKAQADNDILRAQQLYEAAKREDEQLNALKLEAGKRLSAVGDNSITNSLLAGNNAVRDTTSETWADVLKNEESINKIYDSAIESAELEAQMERNEALSKIQAAQAAEKASTDKNLNQAYVNALKNSKNYNEVQTAYGLGSGNMAQQQLARALGLTGTLTDIRNVLADNTAGRGQQQFEVNQGFRDRLADAVANQEKNRADALFDAAESEEQKLIDLQKSLGSTLAAQGDYSVLGKLYGLSKDQVDRLQGTGAYAPRYVSRSGGRSAGGSGTTTLAKALSGYYGAPSTIGTNVAMTQDQVSNLYKNLDTASKTEATKKQVDAERQALLKMAKSMARANARSK